MPVRPYHVVVVTAVAGLAPAAFAAANNKEYYRSVSLASVGNEMSGEDS
jgi:hypothetical protein